LAISSAGEVTFTVRTETANGKYSPKHVLAIWIEDESGFVLTRKLRADKRKQYLYTWNTKSGGNVLDATTGATLSSHQTHTVVWDCMDKDGKLMPDGEYSVNVEFSEKHDQGPLRKIPFNKGAEQESLTPADDANFKDIELSFVPSATSVEDSYTDAVQIYPNPTSGIVTISLSETEKTSVKIFDISGRTVYSNEFNNTGLYSLDISDLKNGNYIIQVDHERQTFSQKLIKNSLL